MGNTRVMQVLAPGKAYQAPIAGNIEVQLYDSICASSVNCSLVKAGTVRSTATRRVNTPSRVNPNDDPCTRRGLTLTERGTQVTISSCYTGIPPSNDRFKPVTGNYGWSVWRSCSHFVGSGVCAAAMVWFGVAVGARVSACWCCSSFHRHTYIP